MLDRFAQRIWYRGSPFAALLLPFSLLFALLSGLRRALYRAGVLRIVRVAKPVIVVGNISVGGTGKTPLVIWLARTLRARGLKPGIVTRGYGGAAMRWPCVVTAASDPREIGDEAALLATKTGGIVVAGPDRAQCAQRAIELGATVIVCDDGLQHYRLARDYEIAVIDAARRFGNGLLLPAGPLREPSSRLETVNAVIWNTRDDNASGDGTIEHRLAVTMRTRLGAARSLSSGESRALREFVGQAVHAVAGIGNPEAFFQGLRAEGLEVAGRSLPDHARFVAADLQFPDRAPVLMTEKDAVKAREFADDRHWSVPLEISIDDGEKLTADIARKLATIGAA